MRICFVKLWHPPSLVDPDAVIDWEATCRGFGEAMATRGHTVTVVVPFPRRLRVERDGVAWEMVPTAGLTRLAERGLRWLGDPAPAVHAPVPAVLDPIAEARPDVIHTFDLVFYPALLELGGLARKLGVPLVTHYHGGAPARNPALRWVERRALARVDRLLFTNHSRGEDWVRTGALPDADRIVELFETSTTLVPGDREAARRRTGIRGDPVYLCAGRLDPVKDPLTTIEGFARIARVRPDARLVMTWTDAPMLREVWARIHALGIADRVELRGVVPHVVMQDLYDSADHLLQSSVREVCGVAVVEALACGVVPIVTDIPPFRRLTGGVGRLFPRGDAVALAAQALSIDPAQRASEARAARARFEHALSFPVLAEELERVYVDALRRF